MRVQSAPADAICQIRQKEQAGEGSATQRAMWGKEGGKNKGVWQEAYALPANGEGVSLSSLSVNRGKDATSCVCVSEAHKHVHGFLGEVAILQLISHTTFSKSWELAFWHYVGGLFIEHSLDFWVVMGVMGRRTARPSGYQFTCPCGETV